MQSAFAPGRVELLGNHTDYNGGVVLSAAIDLGISARGGFLDEKNIILTTEGIPGQISANLDQLKPNDSWSDYPLGVANVLKQAGLPLGGFRAEFSSTLPLGAGLSSSAAIEVCTAVLLSRLFGFSVEPLALAKLCRKAENEFVGVNCGLLDQVSSVFGKAGNAIYLDCRAETVETIPFPTGVGLLIVHSGVKHALVGGEYNERREQCFEAARLLGVPELRDATSQQLRDAEMPDLIRRRAMHVTGENERVFEALKYLKRGDAASFGRLMTESHRSSMENFENSTLELNALVAVANEQPGVYGARLTGGGFGGAVVVLVDEAAAKNAATSILAQYTAKTGHHGAAYHCVPGDGAVAHR